MLIKFWKINQKFRAQAWSSRPLVLHLQGLIASRIIDTCFASTLNISSRQQYFDSVREGEFDPPQTLNTHIKLESGILIKNIDDWVTKILKAA